MGADIIIVFVIIAIAVVLFVTEWVRYDLVAVLVLLSLAITQVIPMDRAIEGFANPAVVTIAAVLVLSGGLYRTGVANIVGAQVMRFAGASPARVTALLMLTAGFMSGVMNNIAATALLLPVVLDISRRLGLRPSRLLIPLAFASLLGGMTTLIGTGPNILLAAFLEQAGEGSFGLFSFTPVGAAALVLGILYMVIAGRHLLPDRSGKDTLSTNGSDPVHRYKLGGTLFSLRIPESSPLHGKSLINARLGQALGIDLLAVRRGGQTIRAPMPGFRLHSDDILFCEGRQDAVAHLGKWGHLVGTYTDAGFEMNGSARFAVARIAPDSGLAGTSVRKAEFKLRYRAKAIAIRRDQSVIKPVVGETRLKADDFLLIVGHGELVDRLSRTGDFSSVRKTDFKAAVHDYGLEGCITQCEVPEGSWLHGKTPADSRLSQGFDIQLLEIQRSGNSDSTSILLPEANAEIRSGDRLIVIGDPESWKILGALQALEPGELRPTLADLESEQVGFAEVTLAPATKLVGKTLREIFFRETYGLTLLVIWRGGQTIHSNIRIADTRLRFGDAFLVYGSRRKIRALAADDRFLVLADELQEVFRVRLAPISSAIMAGVILSASLNLLPVYMAALLGAIMMVFSGCLKPSEVYSQIEWRVVVLLGGMLALGLAMEESGAAQLIASEVIARAADAGPRALLATLFLMCALAAQFVPTSAVAVLMAPLALSTAAELNLSPEALFMVVAVGSSCAFLSPFGHPVNLLVMGVGGYRVTDYARVGWPLFLLLALLVVFYLPLVWPL